MAAVSKERLVDLSHVIEHGMTTHKGLPGPHICDYWTREASAANYDDGSTFQIGRIEMVANTGTYVDSPFHRYADGKDLAELPLGSLAELEGIVVRRLFENGLAVDADAFAGLDVRGRAILVHTGWSRNWRTESYLSDHPFLTEAAARALADGAILLRRNGLHAEPNPEGPRRRRPSLRCTAAVTQGRRPDSAGALDGSKLRSNTVRRRSAAAP